MDLGKIYDEVDMRGLWEGLTQLGVEDFIIMISGFYNGRSACVIVNFIVS